MVLFVLQSIQRGGKWYKEMFKELHSSAGSKLQVVFEDSVCAQHEVALLVMQRQYGWVANGKKMLLDVPLTILNIVG